MKTNEDEWLLFLSEVMITPEKSDTSTYVAAIWFGSGVPPPQGTEVPYGKLGGGGGDG